MAGRLDHVHLFVDDVEREVSLLETAFGGTVRRNVWKDKPELVQVDIGGMRISVSPEGQGSNHIAFMTKDLRLTVDTLVKAGCRVASGVGNVDNRVETQFVESTSGVIFELMQYTS